MKRWLQVAFAGFAVSLLVALALAVWPLVREYGRAERNMRGVEAYGLFLTVANRISAERGPSGVVMSIAPGSRGAAEARLVEARAETDRALQQVLALRRDWAEKPVVASLLQRIGVTRRALDEARRGVDAVAALQRTERQPDDMRRALDAMIAVVDGYQPVLALSAQTLSQQDPSLAGATLVAQGVSDLREFGGRIAAVIIPSFSLGQKLTAEELDRFARAEGRLLEIDRLLRTQTLFEEDETARQLVTAVRERFFGEGLAFLRRLVAQGREDGRYGVDTADVVATYIPALKPLEDLRAFALSRMIESFRQRSHEALTRLVLTLVCSALFLVLAYQFLYSVRATILGPLLAARDMIVALADNRPTASSGEPVPISELRTLFSAIGVLAQRTNERRCLLEQFRLQAETDRLTGLANRRRFEEEATRALRSGRAGRVGLLYFDLDLFKRVNDTYGHQVGDEVLIEVARRLNSLGAGRVCLARLGGDEFAALCPDLDEAAQIALAQAILEKLAAPFEIDGRSIRIGSSIGIAVLGADGVGLDMLCRQADIALYQAKATGRNRYCLYAEGMEAAFLQRIADQRGRMRGEGAANADRGPEAAHPTHRRMDPAA